MKIVISGTTGFVGSNLKASLISEGFEIVELNRTFTPASFSFADAIPESCRGAVWIQLAGKSKDVQKPHLLEEYLQANVALTKKIYEAFIKDDSASTFIYFSSVKAAAANVEGYLTEEDELEVDVPYGMSKRLAEKYLQSIQLDSAKKLIILRPAMIYGPNSKGNLQSLFSFVKKGIPYPFAAFSNSRSLLSIRNLNHVILRIIKDRSFPAGIYNVADDGVISTNEIIELVGKSLSKKPVLWKIPKALVRLVAFSGEKLHLPFNKKVLNKLTDSYAVSNRKLIAALGEQLPYTTRKSLAELFTTLANAPQKTDK